MELPLISLLYVVSLAAFVGAFNARGRVRVAASVFFAILCLCGAVFNTARYLRDRLPAASDPQRSYSNTEPAFRPALDSADSAVSDSGSSAEGENATQALAPAAVSSPPADSAASETSAVAAVAIVDTAPKPAAPPLPVIPVKPTPSVAPKPKLKPEAKPGIKSATANKGAASRSAQREPPAPALSPLEMSKIRLRSELEAAKRLARKLSRLNLDYSSQIPDAEYGALAVKASQLFAEAGKVGRRLHALPASPIELAPAREALAMGEVFLATAAANAESFFQSKDEDEERQRLEIFRKEGAAAVSAFQAASQALDSVATPRPGSTDGARP